MKTYFRIAMIMIIALISGCASMSKEECLNANWRSVGYNDGSRGIQIHNMEKHRSSCSKYDVIPNERAYRNGWNEGIRRYCSTDNGYRAGRSGSAYNNICPADVEPAFLSGWRQGVREYCTPDNALSMGLNGRSYNGVCPTNLAPTFRAWYSLGSDVRAARSNHSRIEQQVTRHEQQMSAAKDPQVIANLQRQYASMLRDEQRADTELRALEACMNNDWYEAGYRDGESGQPRRAREVTGYCGKYGIGGNGRGYGEGWNEGVNHYCSYESGLYIGQSNQNYSGVCSGYGHREFWRGYEEGRRTYQQGKYKHHRPARKQFADRSKEPHDNRDREMRQPPAHSQAADPREMRRKKVEEAEKRRDDRRRESESAKKQERQQDRVHDNRDKLKHPAPGQEQKQADDKRDSGKRGESARGREKDDERGADAANKDEEKQAGDADNERENGNGKDKGNGNGNGKEKGNDKAKGMEKFGYDGGDSEED